VPEFNAESARMAVQAHADDPVACEMAYQLSGALDHIAFLEGQLSATQAQLAAANERAESFGRQLMAAVGRRGNA
jgi:hypothetical protein